MKTTIDGLLDARSVPKEDTVYFLAKDEVNHFPMTAGDFFKIEPAEKWRGDSWPEKLSENGEQTIYNAPLEYKDYL